MNANNSNADAKQRAAQASLAYVRDNMIVGLGTGSTADFFLQALAAAITSGRWRGIRGVPTSTRSQNRAKELGIPITTLAEWPMPDMTIDGADEIAPDFNLIKGLGGALLREKIVAQNSRQLLIIADASKSVTMLGSKSPLPVEVARFGHEVQFEFLRSLGAAPRLRETDDGSPFLTDNGNFIYDCKFEGIRDAVGLEAALRSRAGVVGTGLFLGMASTILIGNATTVEVRRRAQF